MNNSQHASNPPILKPLKGEKPAAFEAFTLYLAMEKRSLRKVARSVRVHESTVRQWSTKFDWVQRVLDYKTQLVNSCLAHELSVEAEQDRVRTERENILRDTTASLGRMLLNVGGCMVRHQVQTNPESISMPHSLQIVAVGAQLAKIAQMQNDGPVDVSAAHWASLKASGDLFYEQLTRAKDNPVEAEVVPLKPAA